MLYAASVLRGSGPGRYCSADSSSAIDFLQEVGRAEVQAKACPAAMRSPENPCHVLPPRKMAPRVRPSASDLPTPLSSRPGVLHPRKGEWDCSSVGQADPHGPAASLASPKDRKILSAPPVPSSISPCVATKVPAEAERRATLASEVTVEP